jgi:hypothetical protein
LIVASISAAFGFAGPLNDLLPVHTGGISGEPAGLVDRADLPAETEAARNEAGSNAGPPKPDTPATETAAAPLPTIPLTSPVTSPVTQAAAASPVAPSPAGSGSGTDEQAGALAAAGEQALGSGGKAVDPEPSDAAAGEPAIADSGRGKTEDRLEAASLPRSTEADPEPSPGPSTTADEPVSGLADPADAPLSAAMIERLLARGERLLRSGDIVPARLVFLRVAAAGDQRGARGVGMTYDPEIYSRLSVTGLAPDREQAELWYDKAGADSAFMTLEQTVADEPDPQDADSEASVASAGAPYVGTEERNAACARKYRSFDAQTGLYKSYSGVMRPCRLP